MKPVVVLLRQENNRSSAPRVYRASPIESMNWMIGELSEPDRRVNADRGGARARRDSGP